MTEQNRNGNEDQRWRELASEYNAPPATPREEMWLAIRERLPERERRAANEIDALQARRARRERLRRWTPWALGVAAAATLAVGFGLGRVTQDTIPAPAAPAPVAESSGSSLPVRMAAVDHLGEAEAMLTLYRSSDRADDRMATARWARELLSTTRLLLDSRVGEDPEVAALLTDLELVLVQIATAGAGGDSEQELIDEGIEHWQLLAKLRTAAQPVTEMAL